MEMTFQIKEAYLGLPIQAGEKEKKIEFFIKRENCLEKVMEFMIPIGKDYDKGYDFLSYLEVKPYKDETLVIRGEMPETFLDEVRCTSSKKAKCERRPSLHFTAQTGWINDPNGLVYHNGLYHLYFQYNPFNTSWQNMSWGHAVSQDLLHWEQKDAVLFPDEEGMMFSGSGIVNEKGMLNLPKEALLFFYTAAGSAMPWCEGKAFTQRIAYSLDNGGTLVKLQSPYLDTICKENRDPKVFWHEESKAYIMSLWLEKNDFALFRTTDLEKWEMTQRFTLEEAWECPDLVKLTAPTGEEAWLFWSADGFYYWGTFDGYTFKTDGIKQDAYINKLAYAAQTYSGDLERIISVPWLRTTNKGTHYTGAMGLPRELSMCIVKGKKELMMPVVKEIKENRKLYFGKEQHQTEFTYENNKPMAVQIEVVLKEDRQEAVEWTLNETQVSYRPISGELVVADTHYFVGEQRRLFELIIDKRILEVSVEGGMKIGMFELNESKVSIATNLDHMASFKVYEIN